MAETLQIYAVATMTGRLMFHTFSQWEERSIYKFCPREDWPAWQKIGYHVRKLLLVDPTVEKSFREIRREFADPYERL